MPLKATTLSGVTLYVTKGAQPGKNKVFYAKYSAPS